VACSGAVVLLALLPACSSQVRTSGTPLLRILATDSSFVVPAVVPGGLTEVRLINQGREIHEGLLAHYLTADANHVRYVDSVRAGVELPAFVEDVGGPGLASPGDSTTAWLDLRPGRYGVYCWNEDHVERGIAQDFEVTASSRAATPPQADLHVGMFEYGYSIRGSWSAGRHTILAENGGTEPHEFDFYRLAEGRTIGDFIAWVGRERHAPHAATTVAGTGDFVPGRKVWIRVTLAPGHYVAFCQVPARSDQRAHYKHGMIREFVVP